MTIQLELNIEKKFILLDKFLDIDKIQSKGNKKFKIKKAAATGSSL